MKRRAEEAALVDDAATYEEPHQIARGIDHIIVNGELVRDGGTFTEALPGKIVTPERR